MTKKNSLAAAMLPGNFYFKIIILKACISPEPIQSEP